MNTDEKTLLREKAIRQAMNSWQMPEKVIRNIFDVIDDYAEIHKDTEEGELMFGATIVGNSKGGTVELTIEHVINGDLDNCREVVKATLGKATLGNDIWTLAKRRGEK